MEEGKNAQNVRTINEGKSSRKQQSEVESSEGKKKELKVLQSSRPPETWQFSGREGEA